MVESLRKQQILDEAEELLLVRGFCGFSYQDISAKLGITKASIHHHFPSKQDLGIALCDRFEAHHEQLATEAEASGEGPRGFIEAILTCGAEMAEMGDRCCPAGVLQAEYNSLPEGLRGRVDELFRTGHAGMTETLEAGRALGQFVFEGEASDQAWLLISMLQGAQLSARVHGAGVFHSVAKQLRSSLLG